MEYSLTYSLCVRIKQPASLNPYSNGILPDVNILSVWKKITCLNPYSNGILPDNDKNSSRRTRTRLNPYSNGILPDIRESEHFAFKSDVLILILMEYSLTIAEINKKRFGKS